MNEMKKKKTRAPKKKEEKSNARFLCFGTYIPSTCARHTADTNTTSHPFSSSPVNIWEQPSFCPLYMMEWWLHNPSAKKPGNKKKKRNRMGGGGLLRVTPRAKSSNILPISREIEQILYHYPAKSSNILTKKAQNRATLLPITRKIEQYSTKIAWNRAILYQYRVKSSNILPIYRVKSRNFLLIPRNNPQNASPARARARGDREKKQ